MADVQKNDGGVSITAGEPGQQTRTQPTLSYPRHWSSPITGVSDDVFIAGVIAEPTLDDLITCGLHYGVKRVRSVYAEMLTTGELPAAVQRYVERMLDDVEIGLSRTAPINIEPSGGCRENQ
ncbi:hypothetical protein [Hydrocarboniphaga effusa]|uniref:hypothetical protein n=1 Tax=Hydrocarboniphaga effusa TaxID=243629 RepID=UPI00398BDC9C